MQTRRFLTVTQVAQRLATSKSTVLRRARAGAIPGAHKLDGSSAAWIFDADVFEAWVTGRETAASP
jgi:excisionase family DNA binding protein